MGDRRRPLTHQVHCHCTQLIAQASHQLTYPMPPLRCRGQPADGHRKGEEGTGVRPQRHSLMSPSGVAHS